MCNWQLHGVNGLIYLAAYTTRRFKVDVLPRRPVRKVVQRCDLYKELVLNNISIEKASPWICFTPQK